MYLMRQKFRVIPTRTLVRAVLRHARHLLGWVRTIQSPDWFEPRLGTD